MAKFKFRITEDTCLEDVERALKELATLPSNEILLNDLSKIFDFLGVEQPSGRKGGTGSIIRFRHALLENDPRYHEGKFSVHVIHGGKDQKKIRKVNYIRYTMPTLKEIIRRKKEEGE